MTNKIKPSQITTPPKIQLPSGSSLVDVLKPEHFELVNPYDFQADGQLGTLPADTPKEQTQSPEDPSMLDPEDSNIENSFGLEAPDLADIISATPTKYTDLNGVDKVKVVFVVRNHVGSSVVGVKGWGG
jgi:hypothetical protein